MNLPHIVIDSHIPYISGVLEPHARVTYMEPEAIDASVAANADALIVRTRTHIGPELLEGSRCRFVATATIGTDHIDLDWCRGNGVEVVSAPGCNAPAVAQYVFATIGTLINRPVSGHTIAIVGVGHVGSIVKRWARALDMDVMCIDPLREKAGDPGPWYTLEQASQAADIITFHTPLTADGPHATWLMAGGEFLGSLRRSPVIINTSRGDVVDNQALAKALKEGKVSHAAIDVWQHEPIINEGLLELCDIATPHIAGYSAAGKTRASQMVLDAVARRFGMPPLMARAPVPPPVAAGVSVRGVLASYDPLIDTAALKAHPEAFEALRNHYRLRPEAPDHKAD